MGLRTKLGIIIVLLTTGGFAFGGYLRITAEREIFLDEIQRRGTTVLRTLSVPCAIALANHDTPTLDNYVVQFAESGDLMDLDYVAVLDHQGRVVAHTQQGEFGKVYDDSFTRTALATTKPLDRIVTREDHAILEMTMPVISGLRWGTIQAGFTLSRMEAMLSERRFRALVAAVVASGAAVLLGYLVLSLVVIRPVLRMSRMAKKFGAGDLAARVQLDQNDELGGLATQLNHMAAQLQGHTGALERLVEERTGELAETNAQLVEVNERLAQLARIDGLTGLLNRRSFMEELDEAAARAARTGEIFSLVMLDVDHFKHYNDRNGHPAGDALLQQLGALLRETLRSTDFIGRYGGEEFIILLLGTGLEEARQTAEKLRATIESEEMAHQQQQPSSRLTASVGFACFPTDASTAPKLIDVADRALYQSKSQGRNRVTGGVEVLGGVA